MPGCGAFYAWFLTPRKPQPEGEGGWWDSVDKVLSRSKWHAGESRRSTQVSQLPKWSYLQWADDIAQMQSSFPNLGYFDLWCLPWAGIIRIAVHVGRRQRLHRFLQHSEFGIKNQFVFARRDEHRRGSSESKTVLSSSRFWIQALAPDFFFLGVIKSVMQLWERCFGNFLKLELQRFSKAFETWSSLRSGSVSFTLHPTKINIKLFLMLVLFNYCTTLKLKHLLY